MREVFHLHFKHHLRFCVSFFNLIYCSDAYLRLFLSHSEQILTFILFFTLAEHQTNIKITQFKCIEAFGSCHGYSIKQLCFADVKMFSVLRYRLSIRRSLKT